MCSESKSHWNSLEVVKLIVTAAVPVLIAYYGYQIRSDLEMKQAEEKAQAAALQREYMSLERVVKWRFDQFEELAVLVNDMYVYFIHVGKWKEFTPIDIIKRKREVDKIIYSFGPIFSEPMKERHEELMELMFDTNKGWGKDAALRTSTTHRKKALIKSGTEWDSNWDVRFTGENNARKIRDAYKSYTLQISEELNIPKLNVLD